MTLLPLFAALALPFAWAAEGPGEAKRAAMERLRGRTGALEKAVGELERLAADHARDEPAPPAADRAALREGVERGVAELKEGMVGYWELDALEKVELGSALLGAVFKGLPERGGERVIRDLTDLGDFPKTVESAIGRGESVLSLEAAAFAASEGRRAEAARRKRWWGVAAAAGALFLAAVVFFLWPRTGKKPV